MVFRMPLGPTWRIHTCINSRYIHTGYERGVISATEHTSKLERAGS
jgi:hypothetical protein